MRRRDSGFSLIELLVVIGIIAILAAILFPMLSKTRERSYQTKCLNNLKQLATGCNTYATDWAGRFPCPGWWAAIRLNNPDMPYWAGLKTGQQMRPEDGSLWRYTKNQGIYKCMTDKNKPAQYAPTNKLYPLSYSMNFELYDYVDSGRVKASKCLLFMHESVTTINDGLYLPSSFDDVSVVHYDGTTVAFVDGHSAWKSKKQLLKDKADKLWATWCNPATQQYEYR